MELVSLSCNRDFTSASSYGLGWYKYAIATQWYQFHTTNAWWFSLRSFSVIYQIKWNTILLMETNDYNGINMGIILNNFQVLSCNYWLKRSHDSKIIWTLKNINLFKTDDMFASIYFLRLKKAFIVAFVVWWTKITPKSVVWNICDFISVTLYKCMLSIYGDNPFSYYGPLWNNTMV